MRGHPPRKILAALAALVFLGFVAVLVVPGLLPGRGVRCVEPRVVGRGVAVLNVSVVRGGDGCLVRVVADRAVRVRVVNGSVVNASGGVVWLRCSGCLVELEPAVWSLRLTANVSGVEALVNGARVVLPAALRVRDGDAVVVEPLPSERYVPLSGRLVLRPHGDSAVTLNYTLRTVTLRIEADAPGARALVNGTPTGLPVELRLPYGSHVAVEPLPLRGYRPANKSVALTLTGDAEIRLHYVRRVDWRFHGQLPNCSQVLVYSDAANTTVTVNWHDATLPLCAPPPLRLQPPIELPLNETHSLWLAWAIIRYRDGSKAWWNPLVNSTRSAYMPPDWPHYHAARAMLTLTRPATVELHYTVALKQLPYVKRVDPIVFVDRYNTSPWNTTIQNYTIYAWGTKKDKFGDYEIFLLLTFPDEIGQVWLQISYEPQYPAQLQVAPLLLLGQEYDAVGLWKDYPPPVMTVWINLTAFRQYWLARTHGEKYKLKNWGNFPLDYDLGVSTVETAGTLVTEPEVLPNTGEQAVLIQLLQWASRKSAVLSVRVVGVGP